MTLLFALVTRDYVIHVSDRQLTDARTGRPIPTKASKTVIVPSLKLMVSYTGLATLGPPLAARSEQMPTVEWLLRALWRGRGVEFPRSLAMDADGAFDKLLLHPALRRHAFLISGWGLEWPQDPAKVGIDVRALVPPGSPYWGFVSNFHDLRDYSYVLSSAQRRFQYGLRPLLNTEKFQIIEAGVPLTNREHTELDNNVRAALRSSRGGVRAAAVAMIEAVQRVAGRTRTVGGGVFVVSVPRNARPPDEDTVGLISAGLKWGLPEPDYITFVHVPDQPSQAVDSPVVLFPQGLALFSTDETIEGRVPDLAGTEPFPTWIKTRLRMLDVAALVQHENSGSH